MTDHPAGKITLKQEGANVLLIVDGKLVSIMPWQAAEQVSKALLAQARKAEEIDKAENIIHDNAILTRAGFPMGLSNHPLIIEETKKEAAHNRDLRRYIPKIGTMEVVHCPSVKQATPRG